MDSHPYILLAMAQVQGTLHAIVDTYPGASDTEVPLAAE